MALVTINFESQYLGNNHNVGIILPDRPRQLPAAEYYASGKKYPVRDRKSTRLNSSHGAKFVCRLLLGFKAVLYDGSRILQRLF